MTAPDPIRSALVAALADLRRRFHRCLILDGTGSDFATAACERADAALALARIEDTMPDAARPLTPHELDAVSATARRVREALTAEALDLAQRLTPATRRALVDLAMALDVATAACTGAAPLDAQDRADLIAALAEVIAAQAPAPP